MSQTITLGEEMQIMITDLLKFIAQQLVYHSEVQVSLCGFNPDHYNGHSLRIGAATTASKAHIEDHLVKVLGLWSSDSYCRVGENQNILSNFEKNFQDTKHSIVEQEESLIAETKSRTMKITEDLEDKKKTIENIMLQDMKKDRKRNSTCILEERMYCRGPKTTQK
ncbi:unnamed protein product [Mytilus coruscus]|uniref:Uncharacterized protein n=1 Tax=Mytilus coruscus TaxID=42192 RepID=A0A6J8C9R1_MYTCO|nr:unnamed protein product [Mytilus coruscus]